MRPELWIAWSGHGTNLEAFSQSISHSDKSPKTHLSALLARVAAGERIVLARNGKPCAQLVPLDPSPRRQLGFMPGRVDAAFFEPLPGDELERWGA